MVLNASYFLAAAVARSVGKILDGQTKSIKCIPFVCPFKGSMLTFTLVITLSRTNRRIT